MTDSPPAPDDRPLEPRDDAHDTPPRDTGHGPRADDQHDDEHDEQPGFPDAPTSPAEGGD